MTNSISVDELISLWKCEDWGPFISLDELVSKGVNPIEVIEAIHDGKLGAFTPSLSLEVYEETHCYLNDLVE